MMAAVAASVSRAVAATFWSVAMLGLCASAEAAVADPGDVQEIVVEDVRAGTSKTRYIETSEAEEHPHSASEAPQLGALAAPRKVALILYRFPGDAAEPWPAGSMRSKIFTAFNSAHAFYDEQSYGSISLSGKDHPEGDVYGWLTLAAPGSGCPFTAWNQEADQLAAGAGFDPAGYDHIVYAFPQRSCGWSGIAELGGSRTNLNGNVGTNVIAHELGHNLGLRHAGSWTCTSGGVRVQISANCTANEYGDPFDVMGNSSGYRHNNGWNLERLDILTPQNVQTIGHSGTYTLRAARQPTSEPTVLRVPRTRSPVNGSITSWYYLEVRGTGGIFENVFDASTSGVSIRATALGGQPETLLVDANPSTPTFSDAPLGVGQSFDGGPVQIRTLAAGGGSATVEIDVDTEPPSIPEVEATVDADGVHLSWVSTDNVGVHSYVVTRDGGSLTSGPASSYIDRFAGAGERTYVVTALDASLNESSSEPLTVTVPVRSGPTCSSSGRCKLTYRHSGAAASWIVPPGIGEASLTVDGARGGGVNSGNVGGGSGARIRARLEPLTAGQVVDISIGGRGRFHSEGGQGGFNGGGDGGQGGGGGGYTRVELDSTLEVVAAGGGGRGGTLLTTTGGSGSSEGTTGGNGFSFSTQGATLGGGKGGAGGGAGGAGGAGGQVTGSSGCLAGAWAGLPGASGGSLSGGGGVTSAGGGGGGGYVGGGQGGGGATDGCDAPPPRGGGGGGGSSLVDPPGLLMSFAGAPGEDGWLSIEYDSPVALASHSHVTFEGLEIDVPAAEGVLAGSAGPAGVPLALTLVRSPEHGSLALDEDDGSFTYEPDPGYLGVDSFTSRLADSDGNYAEATTTLYVAGPPTATIATPADGATFALGQSVATKFSCAEGVGGPGLASCVDSNGAGTVSGGAGSLDTSTLGTHTYTVTAGSGSGLTGSASIEYEVVPAPAEPDPPGDPGDPPDVPGEPPGEGPGEGGEPATEIKLSLGAEHRSLGKLLRSGRLIVTARVNRAARLALRGRARVMVGTGPRARTRLVALFQPRTIRLGTPGRQRVALQLTPKGHRALRNLRTARLTISARATTIGAARETASRAVALTLRR